MYRYFLAFSIFLLILNSLFGQPKKESGYVSPLKLPVSFSGGFGELRKNHFHTGLDFRTSGQTGIPVYAVQEGFVARVSVSPYGYGHALYLVHPDGHTTVYGHLSRFNPKVEAYVLKQQYLLKKFAVDLSIPPGLFLIKKGEIAAWSGNSGSSGGPHLHFEIRDTQSEKPQNPLFYLSGIHDASSPTISSLYVYPLSEISSVNHTNNKLRVETISSKKVSRPKLQQTIDVFGEIGIGIQANDDLDGMGLKVGIYSAELFMDDVKVFSFRMDQLTFDQGRYVNSHVDYEELMKNKRWIHRLFLQPGNKLDIYQTNHERGILKLTDGKVHSIKIIVSDAFQNSNTVTFKLLSKKHPTFVRKATCSKLFYSDKSNDFENDDVRIQIPEGSLYDNLKFEYQSTIEKGSFFSKLQHIHDQYVPVHKTYSLSIKTQPIPPQLQRKALIVLVSSSGKLSPIGGIYKDGWLIANPRIFGDFAVVLDTVPPLIRPLSIKDNKILVNKVKIDFKISDNLSGIETYDGEIDGSWVLFEYDAKTETISYTIDKTRITPGNKHSLFLKVSDERNNISTYSSNFYL